MASQNNDLKNAKPSNAVIYVSRGRKRPPLISDKTLKSLDSERKFFNRDLKSVSGAVLGVLGGFTIPIMLFSALMNKAQSISILHSDLVDNFSLSYFNSIVSGLNLDSQIGTFFGGFLNAIGNVSSFMVNRLSGLTDILSNLFDLPKLLQNIWNWLSSLFS